MKLNDLKHNHSLTDLLKVIIFSILMLMPFLAIATRCLYVIVNKNAYLSYSNFEDTNETIQYQSIDTENELVNGQWYNFNTYNTNSVSGSAYLYFDEIELINTPSNQISNLAKSIRLTTYNTNLWRFYYYDADYTLLGSDIIDTPYILNFNFRYTGFETAYSFNNFKQLLYKYEIIENNTNTLDNVFEYSIDQATQSDLFNWTQNTGIYTGINTMTTQLGIVGVFIPMLLTYWFLLTVIYIIIDIVLKTFTVISHMLIKKAE